MLSPTLKSGGGGGRVHPTPTDRHPCMYHIYMFLMNHQYVCIMNNSYLGSLVWIYLPAESYHMYKINRIHLELCV